MLFLCVLLCLPVIVYVILMLTIGYCHCNTCLVGKTAIVTGGNSGIGFEVALNLASRGCRVIIADKDDSEFSKSRIIEETHNKNVVVKHLDLCSFTSIRKFAKEINETEERLDLLINNAGVGAHSLLISEDGLNPVMQVNYFGPFLLTHLLVDLLKKSAPSRIIFTASCMAFIQNLTLDNLNSFCAEPRFHQSYILYGNTKLCTVIAAKCFAKKLRGTKVTCNSLHPGSVDTPIFNKAKNIVGASILSNTVQFFTYLFSKNIRQGAQTTLHLALSKDLEEVSGKYFWDCRSFIMPPKAWNEDFCWKIWQKSEEFTKLLPEEKL